MKRLASILVPLFVAVALFAQTGDIPAYHKTAPSRTEKLPPIWGRAKLLSLGLSQPVQLKAYELAARIPKVLWQQPCYCHCDRAMGHTSLRSCFADDHGARCGTCMAELYYSYEMTKKGKTPAQIRAGIERGNWQRINLETAASIQ